MIPNAIKQMLKKYDCHSMQEYDQALREILQEITLVGLWRGKFFEHAAFYGGTALRIFYGLDRFSEDLDFTLLSRTPHWHWDKFGEAVKTELASFGFEATFIEKEKKAQTAVKSAFLKVPTVQELLKIGIRPALLKGVHPETIIRVKIEIDTEPPIEYSYEQKFLNEPVAVSIKCVNKECLFACKLYAALFRAWKGRVKGRDWYDVIWFIRQSTPLDLQFFSKLCGKQPIMDHLEALNLIKDRIDQLDIPAAIEDVIHFVRDQEAIKRTWSKEFFYYWINQLITIK